MTSYKLYHGNTLDALKLLPSDSVDCIVTSPPYYGLRSYKGAETVWDSYLKPTCEHEWEEYKATTMHENRQNLDGGTLDAKETSKFREDLHGFQKSGSGFCRKCGGWKGQLGLEPNYNLYLNHLLKITAELKRVLKPSGTMWWNHGQTYSGAKQTISDKSLMQLPERLSIRMVDEQGWILRNIVIWHKPNHMPSSVKDRLSTSYEYIYFFAKQQKYYFNLDAIREKHLESSIKRSARARTSQKYDSNVYAASWKQKYIGYDDLEGKLERGELRSVHPLGKNPGDVLTIGEEKRELTSREDERGELAAEQGMHTFYGHSVRTKSGLKHADDVFQTKQLYSGLSRDKQGFVVYRPLLPTSFEIIKYLTTWKKEHTLDELAKATGLKANSVSHWFTKPDGSHGFSYPSKDDWLKLKELLQFDDTYDKQMTYEETKPAYLAENPLGKNPGDYWIITTKAYKEAHFAVFPPELPQMCIKAGCPLEVCSKCGKPKKLLTKTSQNFSFNLRVRDVKKGKIKHSDRKATEDEVAKYNEDEYKTKTDEVIVYPGCDCNADFVAATVLDPFLGSGTTMMVARQFGLSAIGMEIAPNYIGLIKKRFGELAVKLLNLEVIELGGAAP